MTSNKEETFEKFGKSFQEKLVQLIILDRPFSEQVAEILTVSHLEQKYLQEVAKLVFDYRDKYKIHPVRETIETLIRTEINHLEDAVQTQIRNFVAKTISVDKVPEADFIKDNTIDFCKKQKLKEAMLKAIPLLKSSSFEEAKRLFVDVFDLGGENDYGHDFIVDFEQRYQDINRAPISTGWDIVDSICQGGYGKKELSVVIAPTGCHEKGHPILMYDGEIKAVENIKVGDKVFGFDGEPREVTKLHRGTQQMYEVTINTTGRKFRVNKDHIFPLKERTSKTNNTPINFYTAERIYEKMNEPKRFDYRLAYQISDFKTSDRYKDCDFYYLGFIFAHLPEEYEKIASVYTESPGKLSPILSEIRTFEDMKKIVRGLSLKDRTEVASGIVDSLLESTPHKTNTGIPDSISLSLTRFSENEAFDIIDILTSVNCSPKKRRRKDRAWLFTAKQLESLNLRKRLEYRVIPASRRDHRYRVVPFDLKPVEEDQYFGFELADDKDKVYLDAYNIAHHNSGKSMVMVHAGAHALKQGKNVIYYTLELSDGVVGRRFDSCISEIYLDELKVRKDEVLEAIREVPGKLIVKEYPTKSATVQTLENHVNKIIQSGTKIDMIIVDYADLLKSSSGYTDKRFELEGVYEELRGLATKFEVTVLTASQTNRSGLNAEVVTMESISEAFNKCFVADFIYSLARTVEDRQTNQGRIFVAKNRNGPDGNVYPIFMDTANVKIKVLESENLTQFQEDAKARQEEKIKNKYSEWKKKNGK